MATPGPPIEIIRFDTVDQSPDGHWLPSGIELQHLKQTHVLRIEEAQYEGVTLSELQFAELGVPDEQGAVVQVPRRSDG